MYRGPNTGLLDAQQLVARWDPNKDHTYYFAPGMPKIYQQFFLGTDGTGNTSGLQFQTNQILATAGGKGRLHFLNYNDATTWNDAAGPVRVYGDPRYSFVVWHADLDNSSGLLGVAPSFTNPLTGEKHPRRRSTSTRAIWRTPSSSVSSCSCRRSAANTSCRMGATSTPRSTRRRARPARSPRSSPATSPSC